jgi:hypothetical protein
MALIILLLSISGAKVKRGVDFSHAAPISEKIPLSHFLTLPRPENP